MKKNIKFTSHRKYVIVVIFTFILGSCEKYLEPNPPTGALNSEKVFVSDATAISSVTGIYAKMMGSSMPLYLFNGGLGVMAGLSADELHDFNLNYQDYERNNIPSIGYGPIYRMWSNTYKIIYQANAAIIGLTNNSALSEEVKTQLLGEAHFIRAISYFYLTNLYGKVPIVTGTDYKENMNKPRSPIDEVYQLILADLNLAEQLLTNDYPSAARARPNKYTASALLARVYLYRHNYESAASKASEVINAEYYSLSHVESVFNINSDETIWQLASVSSGWPNTYDAYFYSPEISNRPTYVITENLYKTFEDGDLRKLNWINQFVFDGEEYHYPAKYTQLNETPATEYNIVFRLAEQYLIRAEARAHLGNLQGAIADLNKIRLRAGLNEYDGPMTQQAVLDAIIHERRVELFTEHGHRWFDLKRTDKVNAILSEAKPETWQEHDRLWPIPQIEINANQNLLPNNEGY